jgi:predicted cobalt transporter CbtA
MLRNLLICGLAAGLCAGLLATGVAQFVGEPAVDDAIAFERSHAGAHGDGPVSRDAQRSFGLVTGVGVFGVAVGGLFALVFAVVYGRVADASPARTALWLAAAAFVVVALVPFVKYPPNPPAVGGDGSIGDRTALYFTMMWISVFAAVAAVRLRRPLAARLAPAAATGVALASYGVVVGVAAVALPSVDELPAGFPAATLWEFRQGSLAIQLVLWATIGIVFAGAAQRVMTGRPLLPRRHELAAGARR